MQSDKQKLIEIFNTVKDHLLSQGVKSFDDEEGCAYRGPNNTKCAIGCLIKDEHYTYRLEGKSIYSVHVVEALIKSLDVEEEFITDNINFFGYLQHVHDDFPPSQWREALDRNFPHIIS
jgi:hypothetical protein